MKKKETLTPKQEKFAQVCVETGNASEAYRQVYNSKKMKPDTIHTAAQQLLANYKVAGRIKDLRAEHKARHDFNVDKAHNQYVESYGMAKDLKKPESMISATKAQCDLHGIEPAKTINVRGSFAEFMQQMWDRDK